MSKSYVFIYIYCLLLAGRPAHAGPETGLKFGGSFDLNYVYNFAHPAPVAPPTDSAQTPPPGNNRYRVFDVYHDDFSLAALEVNVQKTSGPIVFYVAFNFGHTADIMSAHDQVSRNVGQAFLTFTPPSPALKGLWFAAGKMLTHMGLEVAKTRENWNYSRSFLFGYAIPFWHVGLAGHYDVSPKLKTALFLYNENSGLYETNRGKSLGAQLHYEPVVGAELIYNYLSGVESGELGVTHLRTLHEGILTYRLDPSWQVEADFRIRSIVACA